LLLSIALALMSCATATPNQPEGAGQQIHGGYSEQRMSEDRFRGTFDGNTLTSREWSRVTFPHWLVRDLPMAGRQSPRERVNGELK
jgi:hypothetical protein